jgi:HEAT repeat protein
MRQLATNWIKPSRIVGVVFFGVLFLPLVFAQERPAEPGKVIADLSSKWRKDIRNYDNLKARQEAFEGFVRLSFEISQLVDSLKFGLYDPDDALRAKAARGLLLLGPAARPAMDELLEALQKDKNAEVRRMAAAALGQAFRYAHFNSDEKRVITTLVKAMRSDKDHHVRIAAVKAFRWLGVEAREAAPEFLELLKEKSDEDMRELWAYSLADLMDPGSKNLGPALLKRLKDGDANPNIERAYLLALGRIGDQEDVLVPLCIDYLHGPKRLEMRGQAAWVLKLLGPKSKAAVPALIRALDVSEFKKDAALGTGMSVIDALGAIGPEAKAAVPALRKIADDRKMNNGLRAAADEAIQKISKK